MVNSPVSDQKSSTSKIFRELFLVNRGVVYNSAFLVYMFTLQIPLLRSVIRIEEHGQNNIIVGILLLLIPLVELTGIHLALPVINTRIGKRDIRRMGLFFVIWVFHIVLNMMVTMVGLDALRGYLSEGIFIGFAFFVVIKELYILLFIMFKPRIKRKLTERQLRIREIWGEVLIFSWSTVTFTVTWVFMSRQLMASGKWWFVAVQMAGALVIFLMLFLPLRLIQFYTEWSLPRTKRQKLVSWLSFAANILAALVVLYLNIPRW